MKSLRRLKLRALILLFALAASCKDDIWIGLPPQVSCSDLLIVEPTEHPIMVPVGGSRTLRVRPRDRREYPPGTDRPKPCPPLSLLSLDDLGWAVGDSSVARLEAHGAGATVTGLAIGGTWIWVGYGGYLGTPLALGGERIQRQVWLEVVESQSREPSTR